MGDTQDKSDVYAALGDKTLRVISKTYCWRQKVNHNVIVKNEPVSETTRTKRTWTPVQTTAGSEEGAEEEVLQRALAIRHMELPVRVCWACCRYRRWHELLLSNVKDEEKHDLALGYIANAHGVDEKAEAEALATRCLDIASITLLRKPWSLSVRFSFFYRFRSW